MTAPLPHWRSADSGVPGQSIVEFDLPDFTQASIMLPTRQVGTPAMESMIRQVVQRREETKDQLREGF